VTDEFSDFEVVPFDPASMATSSLGLAKAIWYKRPWFLVTAVVVVIAAISIITDWPHRISTAEDAASQNATIKQINGDIKPCAFAVSETFRFYNENVAGQLTSSNLAQIPKQITDDRIACSFASGPVYDLTNNIQVVDTTAGKHIDRMLSVVERWMTANALASIEDIQYSFVNPGSTSKIGNLASEEVKLRKNRQLALSDVKSAEKVLGTRLLALKLPVLPHLSGT
jgi:hypothetical protein